MYDMMKNNESISNELDLCTDNTDNNLTPMVIH